MGTAEILLWLGYVALVGAWTLGARRKPVFVALSVAAVGLALSSAAVAVLS